MLAGLAEAHLALGEPTEAVATAREGIDLGSAGGYLYNEALAQLALAAALLATDCVVPRAAIESAPERAEYLVASIEGSALSPWILELRGRLAAAVGDAPSSDGTLRAALDLYRAVGATGHAERLARELDHEPPTVQYRWAAIDRGARRLLAADPHERATLQLAPVDDSL